MIRNGIDRLNAYRALLNGKRIGLITNPSGVNAELEATADILHREFRLTALFGPEHGIRGDAQAGDAVGHSRGPLLGLPVYSLHGASQRIPEEAFNDIDLIVYDIQDVGARFYTYLYTLAYAMEDAAAHRIPVVVLDRVNPLGGAVTEGILLDTARFHGFVGEYPVPTRYGLTVGEYARTIRGLFGTDCDLHVVPCDPHARTMQFSETGQCWVPPSPNIPTPEAALTYIGTCLFEGTVLSEGRGTTHPFEVIGAPFLHAEALARSLRTLNLPGYLIRPVHFTPTFSKFAGLPCHGVQLHLTDPHAARPFELGIRLFDAIRNQIGTPLLLPGKHLFNLHGDDAFFTGAETAEELIRRAQEESARFADETRPFRLY